MIKDLCILLKALLNWNLPLRQHPKLVTSIFKDLVKVNDWIEADTVLMNCLFSMIQMVSVMESGRSCVMEQFKGKPLIKVVLSKVISLSLKPPHTDLNLALMKNGLTTLQICSSRVDVRLMLKNEKIFQILENLHPQIHSTRRSTWDVVTEQWLRFFEFFSRFEDVECHPW